MLEPKLQDNRFNSIDPQQQQQLPHHDAHPMLSTLDMLSRAVKQRLFGNTPSQIQTKPIIPTSTQTTTTIITNLTQQTLQKHCKIKSTSIIHNALHYINSIQYKQQQQQYQEQQQRSQFKWEIFFRKITQDVTSYNASCFIYPTYNINPSTISG
eukprot:UN09521